MTEGNINHQRDQKGVIANDGSKVEIQELHQHFNNPYKPGIPFQVPPVPQHFVPRPQYADRIREQLLSNNADQPGTLVVSAIHGLGGIGKSVLAAALGYESEIRDRFPDGILWITLGQQPDLLVNLGDWIRALGDRDYKPTTVAAASSYLRSLLVDKTMLLVVDDLWDPEHFEPFRLAGKCCRVLVTTRQVRLKDAQPCELGLLTAAESVALVERRLGGALAEGEREIFEEFARAVGYLPLALELAAVQVEDGYDWASLLADFREEFDILDVDEGAGSDEVRRDRSLRACFNLSLKRLDGEQLRRFAWLGVLPEDVSVDARMAATLWEVKLVRARKGLLELRRRSLLLSGVSISVAGRQEPTFRQHDLLHELAQKQLEGLGLSVEAAHGELLTRYRPESGRWWELADDGYIHRRLTWHMERAGQIAEMHELIRAADDNGRNAWGEACEKLGLLTVFVEDVARAWRCAEERYGVIPTEAEGWRWQFWCAFAIGSLNSLVGNIPGELLAIAVRQGHWSEARAVAYALQQRNESERVFALVDLMPELKKKEVVALLIQAARGMVSESNRSWVFLKAIEHQQESWELEQLKVERKVVLRRLMGGTVPEALDEKLSLGLFDEALAMTRQMANDFDRAKVLCTLATKLPTDLFSKVIDIARQISDEYAQSRAMRKLADNQSGLFSQALEVARKIPSQLPRAMELSNLEIKHPELFAEALDATRQIPDKADKSWMLAVLSGRHPELFEEVLDVTRQISDKARRFKVLNALSEDHPELFKEVLTVARQIANEFVQSASLIQLSEKWPNLFDEALKVTRQLPNNLVQKAIGLVALAKGHPELFEEALEVTRAEMRKDFRSSLLH
ncbi:MAG: NB-ARC domain-containing protein, partial [Cyanobacteria bacterium P01_D01_bin.73]